MLKACVLGVAGVLGATGVRGKSVNSQGLSLELYDFGDDLVLASFRSSRLRDERRMREWMANGI